MKKNVIFLSCLMAAVVIGCNTGDEDESAQDPEGTIALDMASSSERIDNTISIVDGNFTGALFATVGKVKGLTAVSSIPPTGWANKLAVEEGYGYIAYSPSEKTYWRMFASMYDAIGSRAIIKFQRPFIGSEKEMKLQNNAAITLVGTEPQNIEFANSTLFPFSWSFENTDYNWCYASYSRSDENAPYNSTRIYASNNSELAPRECTLVLKSDIGKDVKIKIVQAANEVEPVLSLNKSGIEAVAAAKNYPVEVTSNGAWKADSDASWCTLTGASGEGNGTLTVKVKANTGTDERDATITVTSGTLS
ncbi:MAG: BACON domain-containing protein, partial [Prevotellaceae bacterium]|nr:BACON domain-containing protein [Prevotellaceae bacterium]